MATAMSSTSLTVKLSSLGAQRLVFFEGEYHEISYGRYQAFQAG